MCVSSGWYVTLVFYPDFESYFFPFLQQMSMSTLERKKKNFSFTRKFPFMKSRDNIDDASDERKFHYFIPYSSIVLSSIIDSCKKTCQK